MSTEPAAGPDPDDDYPPRHRWVLPAVIGLAIGALFGGAAIFIVMSLAAQTDDSQLVAEKFNINNVLSLTQGAEYLTAQEVSQTYIGSMGRDYDSGTAVHRRFRITGRVGDRINVESVSQTLKNQVDAELARHGTYVSGGTMTSSSGDSYVVSCSSSYITPDGRRGMIDFDLEARNGMIQAVLILTEGQ